MFSCRGFVAVTYLPERSRKAVRLGADTIQYYRGFGYWVTVLPIDRILSICLVEVFRAYCGFSISRAYEQPKSSPRTERSSSIFLPFIYQLYRMLGLIDTTRRVISFFDPLLYTYADEAQRAYIISSNKLVSEHF